MKKMNWLCGFSLLAAILVLPVPAQAAMFPLTNDFGIEASSGSDVGTWTVEDWTDSEYYDGSGKKHVVHSFLFGNPDPENPPENPIIIYDASNEEIAEIDYLKIVADTDPIVDVDFLCKAITPGGGTVTFSFFDSLTDFTVTNPIAAASAGVTATDRNANGVTITGLWTDGNCYEARYNDDPVVYTDLAVGGSLGAGQTYTSNGSVGPTLLPETATSMEAEFYFTLSNGDAASGTSHFEIVPEPATLGLALAGALMVLRRRARQ